MKELNIALLLMLTAASLHAEKYMTRTGSITFSGVTTSETIQATNTQVACVLDTDTAKLAFKVLVKGFEFEKALMQQSFNSDYMDSERYPNAQFDGKLEDLSKVNFSTNGTYKVTAIGNLTIHNVAKNVSVPGDLVVKDGQVTLTAKFPVKPTDYSVTIPASVSDKIATVMEVTVACTLSPQKK